MGLHQYCEQMHRVREAAAEPLIADRQWARVLGGKDAHASARRTLTLNGPTGKTKHMR
jgi:hypothetical protein